MNLVSAYGVARLKVQLKFGILVASLSDSRHQWGRVKNKSARFSRRCRREKNLAEQCGTTSVLYGRHWRVSPM